MAGYTNPRQITGKMRSRVSTCVLYPDSAYIELVDRLLEDAHIQAARSPLHDRDTFTRTDIEYWLFRHNLRDFDITMTDDELMAWISKQEYDGEIPWIGDFKKAHYHYIVAADGSKSYQQLYELFGGYTKYFEKVESKRGALCYLIHKNDPDKAQYDFNDIKTYGGMDVSCILQMSELEQINYIDRIEDHIFKRQPRSYVQLVRWARKQEDINYRKTINSNQYHFKSLIFDLNQERSMARRAKGRGGQMLDKMEQAMSEGASAQEAFTSVTGFAVVNE